MHCGGVYKELSAATVGYLLAHYVESCMVSKLKCLVVTHCGL